MSYLTRYVLRQTLFATLFICIAFSVAVWLVQSLRLVDFIVNRGLSVGLFLYFALLILPRLVEVILPVAVFIAVLFVYNRLIAESELVVMRAAGMSHGALARPAMLAASAITLALYILSFWLLPAANRSFKDLQFEIRNRFVSVLIQDGVFNTISDHLMVYVTNRDPAGELVSLLIYDTRNPQKPVTIFAQRGAFVETPDGPRILMVKGTRQQLDHTTGHLSVLTFDKYTLDLGGLSDAPEVRDRQPDERTMRQLIFPRGRSGQGDSGRALFVELNQRIVAPLEALAMAALPLLCLLPGEFNRRGQARRVLLAIGLAVLLEVVDIGLRNLAGRSEMAIPFMYLNALLPLAALLWFLWRDTGTGWSPSLEPMTAG